MMAASKLFTRLTGTLKRQLRPRTTRIVIAVACNLVVITAVMAASGSLRVLAMQTMMGVTSLMTPHDELGQTNVLLLGVGDKDHAAADLTDSIMIASIDPDTRSAVLISIPRDLHITSASGAAPGRINSLYWQYKSRVLRKNKNETESGASIIAMRQLADEISRRTGVPIHGAMKMDFSGFEQAIDAVGGVDVDVPKKIVDYSYPLEEGVVGTLTIEAGPQHMDGKKALQYSRSRHSTSDFDRSARQQQILSAFADKMKGLNLITDADKLHALTQYAEHNLETTFTFRQMIGLAGMGASLDTQRIIRMNLNYSGGGDFVDAMPGGFVRPASLSEASGAVLFPVSLTKDSDSWAQIAAAAQMLVANRSVYLAHPMLSIESSEKNSYQARLLRNELLRYGFAMGAAKNVILPKDTEVVSHVEKLEGGDMGSATFFADLLRIPLNERSVASTGSFATIRIVLDDDYEFTPFATDVSVRL